MLDTGVFFLWDGELGAIIQMNGKALDPNHIIRVHDIRAVNTDKVSGKLFRILGHLVWNRCLLYTSRCV